MNTKRILADSLKDLLGKRALGDITVQDITAASGLSRSTFYKHFTDKYDLVGWMLPSDRLFEFADSVDEEGYETTLKNVVALIEEWRVIYMNAVNDPYEEMVYSKILEHTYGFYERAFVYDSELDESESDHSKPDDGESDDGRVNGIVRQLAIKQITDFLLSWVLGKVSLTSDEVLEVLTRLWSEEIFR